jgi:hypothetical protein
VETATLVAKAIEIHNRGISRLLGKTPLGGRLQCTYIVTMENEDEPEGESLGFALFVAVVGEIYGLVLGNSYGITGGIDLRCV